MSGLKVLTCPKRPGLFQVGEDVGRDALARLDASVQVALEVLRGVLPAEVAVAAPFVLGAREARVLADLPVRVRAERPRVRRPEVERRAAVPRLRRAREHRLDLAEELLRAGRG